MFDKWRNRFVFDGTTGLPRSSNAASSFHLWWDVPDRPWVEIEAVLEILVSPRVAALSFWALQVTFMDEGLPAGGAHLGLQWHRPHPGSTAANWGGYRPAIGGFSAGELEGSPSLLPSAPGNVNTRDFAWAPKRCYRLRVAAGESQPPPGLHAWRGEVTDLETGIVTVVRDLWSPGTRLASPVVWSEVFARCDDPSSSVRGSGLRLTDTTGTRHDVTAVSVNYQGVDDGGCVNTNSSADDIGVVQTTGTLRATPQGTRLMLAPTR